MADCNMCGGKLKKQSNKNEKIPCKYGSSCYQKNPDHHKRYSHPEKCQEDIEEPIIKLSRLDDVKEKKCMQAEEKDKKCGIEKYISKDRGNQDQEQLPPSPCHIRDKIKQKFLVEMPQDFFDFWEFCKTIDKVHPEEAFSVCGLHLVGPFDVLSGKLENSQYKSPDFLIHWRYYYDPPEFQTIIKKDGDDLFHIGYFRDEPLELPSVVVSNCAATGPKLVLMGDNLFAAVNTELTKAMKKLRMKEKEIFAKYQKNLQKFSKSKNYSLEAKTAKTKARDKKVVSKTFHGLGIVVPLDKKNDIGYRPLPETNGNLKKLLTRIVESQTEKAKLEELDKLQEIITCVQFANDECDYGMGLELGIDLFCFGDSYFHRDLCLLLSMAYELLDRKEFSAILQAHMQNRKKGDLLSIIQ